MRGNTVIFWYFKKTSRHPNDFPPGPRLPLPILGDSYKLGIKNLEFGCQSLIKQYGKIVGLWLGPDRAVVISDFEVLQDILKENTARQHMPAIRKFMQICKVCIFLKYCITQGISLVYFKFFFPKYQLISGSFAFFTTVTSPKSRLIYGVGLFPG